MLSFCCNSVVEGEHMPMADDYKSRSLLVLKGDIYVNNTLPTSAKNGGSDNAHTMPLNVWC